MESEHYKIPDHILNLQNIEYFYKLILELLCDYGTKERAYNAAERMYFNSFQKNRYKNFESYRQAEIRFLKKNNKNINTFLKQK